MKEFYIYILSVLILSVYADENILCTSSVCDGVKCAELPPKCKIQNATHNGIFLPSPEKCNCCDYCLENLDEGDQCSTGNPSTPTYTTICGPGLYCKLRENSDYDGFCRRMNTPCYIAQDDYDNRRQSGSLGSMELRQSCEGDGTYSSYKCIPGQTCYCVAKNGSRIFGESDFTGVPSFDMQCRCSRDHEEAVDILGRGLGPSEFFRCSSTGDYDTVQCIGRHCLCVDAVDGAPTFPNDDLVNMTLISSETLRCFSGDDGIYYKKCEEEYVAILEEINSYKEDGFEMVFSYIFPKCDLDGSYQAIQENSTHKMCVDKEGVVLTAVDKIENETLANTMDCKCLRASSLMSSREKPTCEVNGNYSPIQCRRGICRCVDTDGNQVCTNSECEVREAQKDNLKC